MRFTIIWIGCMLIVAIIAIVSNNIEKQKDQAILDYYQDTETLLDSLYMMLYLIQKQAINTQKVNINLIH